jgi:PKD repeat protein
MRTTAIGVFLVILLMVFILPASAAVQPANGGNTLTVSGVILPGEKLSAAFSAKPLTGPAPLVVQFADASTGAIASREWAYRTGSGSWKPFSTKKNPSFTFTTLGTYDIRLKVSGSGGSDDKIKTKYITAKSSVLPPVALFSQDKYYGRSPLTIHFNDHSRNNPTSYFWRFGDGSSSTEKNPTHQFTRPGFYIIQERVTNAAGSDTAFSAVVVTRNGWWWFR